MAQEELLFLPLGGAGEIGMNLNLYGFGAPGDVTWVMVDLGITFGDAMLPGVDVMMPDPHYIVEHKDRLAGLVLTHAHEDHIGAVAHLWEKIGRPPIYATPFTAQIVGHKLAEAGLVKEAKITVIALGGKFSVGPFDMELITLTHSIPEPNAIAIRTKLGTVLHTGDWKFDPDPVLGAASDEAGLEKLGDEGVLAMVCDSTNVFTPGTSGSEGDLLESLTKIIAAADQRVVVTCFSSNVARIETVARAAKACGRDVVLSGRSLQRMVAAARDNGYLQDTAKFLEEDDAGFLPRDKTLIVCTGSQGEPRAALARMAADDHPRLTLNEGDTVIFSSRIIPGNEVVIGRMQNRLVRGGIHVVTEKDAFVHVSGHPARDELVRMYQRVRPKIAVPVHGELRHISEHARLAKTCQVTQAVVNENGGMIRLAPGDAAIIEEVPSGRLTLEGNRLVPLDSELVRGRTRSLFNGEAVVSVVVEDDGILAADPQITTTGLLDPSETDLLDGAVDIAANVVDTLSKKARSQDDQISEAVRIAVRRYFRNSLNKNAVVKVQMIRLGPIED
ncbi:ribonuclease J [Varunaivibrio sulfuroxidans]|uniref:Ribonuclease J n=1 Tax=Varunaivibrio sulfuroxidans TaxID=1773489 RepID=A0A4R3JH80_9PROT|nr:ribonuclease J [Varunaivibrio sulfuroxidans]TCS64140.1 ribonuclease J [Varunaivibrio sulfuroxidans]WES31413.1 ribonuclease J [Varunaivibrio sulfuroxidans]